MERSNTSPAVESSGGNNGPSKLHEAQLAESGRRNEDLFPKSFLVELGVYGNSAYALLGENFNDPEGEVEFVNIYHVESPIEIATACGEAFKRLRTRLENPFLLYKYAESHPYYMLNNFLF